MHHHILDKNEELKQQRLMYAQNSKVRERKKQKYQEKRSRWAGKSGQTDKSSEVNSKENMKSQNTIKKRKCKACKKKFVYTSFLKYIGHKESCKSFYGEKFRRLKDNSTVKRKKDYNKKRNIKKNIKCRRNWKSSK